MNFPKDNKLPVKFYYNCMALTIEDSITGQLFGRKYYFVTYIDGSECIFLTTNEFDLDYNEGILDEDFRWIPSFKMMLDDFENSEIKNLIDDTRFNGPPFYIYYDILLIDDALKPIILKHLEESILGYTDVDFTKKEQKQLKIWLSYLKK
ncbi:MAG: hypothetical protein ACOH1N_00515 [Lutibacter sp.]